MTDQSEEKSLPASRKKLEDARKKGQVARSQDLVAAVALFAATLYVVAMYPTALSQFRELLELASHAYDQEFGSLWPRMIDTGSRIVLETITPLLAIAAISAVVANLIVTQGLVFSFEPIRPNFDHINPAQGLKRIFSLRSAVEFLKSVVKVVALSAAFLIVFAIGLQALLQSPSCGMACVYDTSLALLQPIIITAIIVFFVVGAVDVLLQRQLFLRDMRMTKTEAKREFKDLEGDPQIKRERRRRAEEMVGAKYKVGLKNASIMIGKTKTAAVGLRFVRGETPVPILVCRATGPQSNVLMTEANLLGIPVINDEKLARSVLAATAIGDPVPEALFQPVADLLVAAKLV